MGERVVVTGIGPVTPVGTGVEDFWTGLTTGRNGIRRITAFDTADLCDTDMFMNEGAAIGTLFHAKSSLALSNDLMQQRRASMRETPGATEETISMTINTMIAAIVRRRKRMSVLIYPAI